MIVPHSLQVLMHRMITWMTLKRTLPILLLVALVMPMVAFTDKPVAREKDTKEASLLSQLRVSQDRIISLEQIVADLQKQVKVLKESANPPDQRAIVEVPQNGPRKWVPREINGLTYFAVPLTHGSAVPQVLVPAVLR